MIKGQWFKPNSAASCDAVLFIEDNHYQLKSETETIKTGLLNDIQVSDRIGNIQRKLTFDDGSVFSTGDNDAIDLAFISTNKIKQLIHTLESKIVFVLLALVTTVIFSFSFVKWGIPAISTGIAEALPQKTNNLIGIHTFDFINKYLFEESSIKKERQEQIRTNFKQLLIDIQQDDKNINYTLHFREWDDIPNALALPSGDIIITDKFIELTKNQDEINTVILHEIGHVAHRHGLKTIVQSTIVTTAVMMITGDSNTIADLGISLGTMLLSSNYSRDFESDADKFAFDHMLKLGIDPLAFASIMHRISTYTEDELGSKKAPKKKTNDISPNEDIKEKNILDYLSTHPPTKERVQIAEHYSACFKQGLKICPSH